MAIEVVATKNGPFLVTGDLTQLDLRDGDGNLYDVSGRHHSKIGFQAAEAAVAREQA
jgi:hypothetical protein